jgi:glutamine amidotransferase-like uncharacterized protein
LKGFAMIYHSPIVVDPEDYKSIMPYVKRGKHHRLSHEKSGLQITLLFTLMQSSLQTRQEQTMQLVVVHYRYRLLPSLSQGSIFYFFCNDRKYTGISTESVYALLKAAHKAVACIPTLICNKVDIQPSLWQPQGVLVFPGGRCSDWKQSLTKDRSQKILSWFRNGGRIWATCAGGYYCSSFSEYQINANQKITAVRELALFPGKCLGPLYSFRARAVKIRWERSGQEGYVIVLGGGCFMPFGKQHSYEVLARFVNQPKELSIAVVKCRQKAGVAILSGPHWEFSEKDFAQQSSFSTVDQTHLKTSASFRKNCIKEMLEELIV